MSLNLTLVQIVVKSTLKSLGDAWRNVSKPNVSMAYIF